MPHSLVQTIETQDNTLKLEASNGSCEDCFGEDVQYTTIVNNILNEYISDMGHAGNPPVVEQKGNIFSVTGELNEQLYNLLGQHRYSGTGYVLEHPPLLTNDQLEQLKVHMKKLTSSQSGYTDLFSGRKLVSSKDDDTTIPTISP